MLAAGPTGIGFLVGGAATWVLVAVGGDPTVVSTPIVAIVATLQYFDARIRFEGFDLQVIAAELGPHACRRLTSPVRPPAAGRCGRRPTASSPDPSSTRTSAASSSGPATRWVDWLEDLLGELAGGGGGQLVGWAVVVVLRPSPRWSSPSASPGAPGGTRACHRRARRARRPPAEWRAEAADHEAAGRWRPALRCRYRALRGRPRRPGPRRGGARRTRASTGARSTPPSPTWPPPSTGPRASSRGAWYGGPRPPARTRPPASASSRPRPRRGVVKDGLGRGGPSPGRASCWPCSSSAGPDGDGPPLDPSSSGRLGTRALVLLLEDLGADVSVHDGGPEADDDVALVLADALDDGERAAVRRHVERRRAPRGGRPVLAPPARPARPTPWATGAPRAGVRRPRPA